MAKKFCKNDGKRQKMAFSQARHIATSGARHFTFSSTLLRCLLPTVQLTFFWIHSAQGIYNSSSLLQIQSIHNKQRQLLCGSSFFLFFVIWQLHNFTSIFLSSFIYSQFVYFFLNDEKDGSDEYNLPVISNWLSIHWGLRGLGSGESLSEKGSDLKVEVFSPRF